LRKDIKEKKKEKGPQPRFPGEAECVWSKRNNHRTGAVEQTAEGNTKKVAPKPKSRRQIADQGKKREKNSDS